MSNPLPFLKQSLCALVDGFCRCSCNTLKIKQKAKGELIRKGKVGNTKIHWLTELSLPLPFPFPNTYFSAF